MNDVNFFQTNSNVNFYCLDLISNSGINNFSEFESNINSEINMFSNNNINYKESESNILLGSYSEHKNSLILKGENKETLDPFNLNLYIGKNSYSEPELNNIELKENSLISLGKINHKSSEKSVKNINKSNNLSYINIDNSNNFKVNYKNNSRQSNNNEILDSKEDNKFVDKKRKRILFIQNENVNDTSINTSLFFLLKIH